MIWWFVILALSAGAVFWAGVSAYLRVKDHLTGAASLPGDAASESARKE
jgi:hypothetical protein